MVNVTSNAYTIQGLVTYTEYSVRVTMSNVMGVSDKSAPINYFTAEECKHMWFHHHGILRLALFWQ